MGESAQAEAASKQQLTNANWAQGLANIQLPQLQGIINRSNNELNTDFASVRSIFNTARTHTGEAYDQALQGGGSLMKQQALQSGGVFPQSVIADQLQKQAWALKQQKDQAMGGLRFQEQQAKMTEYSQLMNTLSGVNQQLLAGGGGYGQAALGAIGGMSNTSPGGAALSGAAAGASIGTQISPGWGTLIGGVAGGAAGYFSA